MKFFKTSDDRFINPQLVTNCYATRSDTSSHVVRFFFQENSVDVYFESKSYAESEVLDFLHHCEEI